MVFVVTIWLENGSTDLHNYFTVGFVQGFDAFERKKYCKKSIEKAASTGSMHAVRRLPGQLV